jgi:hypothetical protein
MALVAEDEATNQPIPRSKTARCLVLTLAGGYVLRGSRTVWGMLVYVRPSFACCSPPTTALLAILGAVISYRHTMVSAYPGTNLPSPIPSVADHSRTIRAAIPAGRIARDFSRNERESQRRSPGPILGPSASRAP